MTLTNRFSTLLLAALGLTLTGFSTALFVSSRVYLNRQVDDRLTATLSLLNTCVERNAGWVRWEPRQKRLPPSHLNEHPASTWLVFDGAGRVLTRPRNLSRELLTPAWDPRAGRGLPARLVDHGGRAWRAAQRRVRPTAEPAPEAALPPPTANGKTYHDEVLFAAFVSVDETEATVKALGWLLAGVSALTWGLAALCARWLSRKTLVPLTRLVESARRLDASEPGWSLPDVGTRDELDELRRAFNDLLGRLHAAYERQRRFSSEASHQLRTPVAVIAGHLEVALRGERTAAQYQRVVEVAHRRSVALGQIVESLLFLSRNGPSTLVQTELLELSAWLKAQMDGRPSGPRSGDIAVRAADAPPLWVRAQPHLLAQLVENLVENACKYSQSGTPIVIAAAREAETVVLSVEDAGQGIAREDIPRIFEPFFRATRAAAGRVSGVGLGLSIVERIAHAFGGTVAVDSAVGRGSRFEVRLPLDAAPAHGLRTHSAIAESAPSA